MTSDLTLTVLGTAFPHPAPDRPGSGYLLRGGGAEVWVDAGFGTFAELQRHTDPARIDAVRISPLHAGLPGLGFARPGGAPVADLLAAVYGLAYGGLTPSAPIPVHAPAGRARRLAGFFGRSDADFLDGVLDFRPLCDGQVVRHGGLVLASTAVVHGVEAHGLRAECAGRVLAHFGDSGPCAALTGPARDADPFLCEAETDEHRESERVHLTSEDAGDIARRAGVRELPVTHVGPTLPPEAVTARAASAFGGPTATAREDRTYAV